MISKIGKNLSLQKDREILQGLRVLAVDDNKDSLFLNTFILENYGIKVTIATSAREALGKISTTQQDILISDLAMPEEDGYWLIRQIRKLEPKQRGQIPAMALTAYASEKNPNLSREAGFQLYRVIPIEPTELVEAIISLFRT